MSTFTFFLTDSLQKVFPIVRLAQLADRSSLSVLGGEIPAVQLVYHRDAGGIPDAPTQPFTLTVTGAPVAARLRSVELVPTDFPCYEDGDAGYLSTEPGLYPDLLADMPVAEVTPLANQYRAVWVDFPGLTAEHAGSYTVTIQAAEKQRIVLPNAKTVEFGQAPVFQQQFTLEVLPVNLPAQTVLHTEWMHADCLADYYGVAVCSEAWWQAVDSFIEMAAGYTCNVMLTPVFTPPLDTAVGGERTTVQLVDVFVCEGAYSFGFEKLQRWCAICQKHGISHIEVAHLFTQWGATATPKIMATVDGEEKRLFGWDVPAVSSQYRTFLEAFLPALQGALHSFGYTRDRVIFHISDEPAPEQIESYRAACAQVEDLLEGYTVMDAMSDLAFYQKGIVKHPIAANDHIQPFIDSQVPDLWVYYCCAQCMGVPNRFYAMPSARNRIMGTLMYLYGIRGFLHWGYNFYSSQFSLSRPINPYYNTSASHAFPSGDPYLVYPAENLRPAGSIRGEVLRQSFHDIQALQLLESLVGRERTIGLVMEDVGGDLTFKDYPEDASYLLHLHEKILAEIRKSQGL